jgi:hypothetical protein
MEYYHQVKIDNPLRDVMYSKDVKEANIGDYPTPCKEKEFDGTWE